MIRRGLAVMARLWARPHLCQFEDDDVFTIGMNRAVEELAKGKPWIRPHCRNPVKGIGRTPNRWRPRQCDGRTLWGLCQIRQNQRNPAQGHQTRGRDNGRGRNNRQRP